MTVDGYKIGEIAKEFDVSLRTIRYYEQRGYLTPRRCGAHRIFDEADRIMLKHMVAARKWDMPLEDAGRYATLRVQGAAHMAADILEVAIGKTLEEHSRIYSNLVSIKTEINNLTNREGTL